MNTRGETLYKDDFKQTLEEYARVGGQTNASRARFSSEYEISGRFHANWLNMLFPRLLLARDLLTESGSILISIDDSEQANLKKTADEIFGEDNFICRFTWNTKKAAQGLATAHMVVDNCESIYVYARRASLFKFRGLDRDEKDGFANPDEDPRGPWKRQYLQRIGQGLPIRTIVDPATKRVYSFETPYAQEKLERWVVENRIVFPNGNHKYPARKEFLYEYKRRRQLVTSLGLYPTKASTERLNKLFDGVKIFSNPKPLALIKFLVRQTTEENDLVLDFFSGSATTGHAVMQLNAEDGGARRFILAQSNEPTPPKSEARKAGFDAISQIGRERLARAGIQVKKEFPKRSKNIDLGFRFMRVVDADSDCRGD